MDQKSTKVFVHRTADIKLRNCQLAKNKLTNLILRIGHSLLNISFITAWNSRSVHIKNSKQY